MNRFVVNSQLDKMPISTAGIMNDVASNGTRMPFFTLTQNQQANIILP